eukprot:1147865-Pelagomonas_calceolata.AAC.7
MPGRTWMASSSFRKLPISNVPRSARPRAAVAVGAVLCRLAAWMKASRRGRCVCNTSRPQAASALEDQQKLIQVPTCDFLLKRTNTLCSASTSGMRRCMHEHAQDYQIMSAVL